MQPITRPIRWGILGTGAIAAAFCQLTPTRRRYHRFAVGSRGQTSADDFAQTHDVDRAYASYSELVADPDVDVVYVATPHTAQFRKYHAVSWCGQACALRKTLCSEQRPNQKNGRIGQMQWIVFDGSHVDALYSAHCRASTSHQSERNWASADDSGGFGFRAPLDPQSRLFNPALAGVPCWTLASIR